MKTLILLTLFTISGSAFAANFCIGSILVGEDGNVIDEFRNRKSCLGNINLIVGKHYCESNILFRGRKKIKKFTFNSSCRKALSSLKRKPHPLYCDDGNLVNLNNGKILRQLTFNSTCNKALFNMEKSKMPYICDSGKLVNIRSGKELYDFRFDSTCRNSIRSMIKTNQPYFCDSGKFINLRSGKVKMDFSFDTTCNSALRSFIKNQHPLVCNDGKLINLTQGKALKDYTFDSTCRKELPNFVEMYRIKERNREIRKLLLGSPYMCKRGYLTFKDSGMRIRKFQSKKQCRDFLINILSTHLFY